MNDILNYVKINELISSSGQPTQEQFKKIKEEGFEVVISLVFNDESNPMRNEDEIVTNLGMTYFHIPVDFENPKVSDVKLFLNTLQALGANKVWVHCTLNHRVSAFMYVYHKYVLRTPFEEIDLSIFEQWGPDEKWQTIMKLPYEELQKA